MSKKGKSKEVVNPLALPVDYKLREYRVLAVLGKGGFGITYLAEDLNLGKKVAIKELLPDGIATRGARRLVLPQSPDRKADFDWARESFIEEARILADLVHPNIVGVMRLLEANGTAYMVMEYVEGEPLRDRIKRREPPAQIVVDEYLRAILSGLRRVHERNLLHRDIKPENILVRATDRQPVLIDFGAARTRASGQSQHVTSIISPGYSPWEQYSTEVHLQGPWSDIYALAAVVYHWIAGERPPESPQRVSRVNRDEADPYEPLAIRAADLGYDIEFLEAIDKALEVRETSRPQTVAEWEIDLGLRAMSAAELEAFKEGGTEGGSGQGAGSVRSVASSPVVRPSRRNKSEGKEPEGASNPVSARDPVSGAYHWLVGALLVALLAIIALLVMLLDTRRAVGPDLAFAETDGGTPSVLGIGTPSEPGATRRIAPGPGDLKPEPMAPKDKPEPEPRSMPEIPVEPPSPPPVVVSVTTSLRSSSIEKSRETVYEVISHGGPLTEYPLLVVATGLNVSFQRVDSGISGSLGRRYLYRVIGETVGFHTIPPLQLRAGTQEIATVAETVTVTAPPPPPPKTREEIVRETLHSYLAAGGSASYEDQNDYYASSVDYFGKSMSRSQINVDYQEFRRSWPIRKYEVNGPIAVSGFGDSWIATFQLDYLTGDGIILKQGSVEKQYGLRFSGEGPEITSISTIREISDEKSFSKGGYEQIIRFIDLFCESGSSFYTGSIPRLNLYDEQVNYFDKNLSRAGVAADQASWNAKLYSHSYRRNGEPNFIDLKDRKIQMTFPMIFENNGPKGRKSGTVMVTLRIRYSDNAQSMWIYHENSAKP